MKKTALLIILISSNLAFGRGDDATLSGDPLSFEVLKLSSVILGQRDSISQVIKGAGLSGELKFWRGMIKKSIQDSTEKIVYTLETQACADVSKNDSCISVGDLIIEESITQNQTGLKTTFNVTFTKNTVSLDDPIYDDALLLASVILQNRDSISQRLKEWGVESPVKFSRGTVNEYVPQSMFAAKMTLETKMCSDIGTSQGCYWVFNLIIERKVTGSPADPKVIYEISYKSSGLG